MNNTEAEQLARIDAVADFNRQRASSQSFQLSTWVLVGHAAGLYFVINTALSDAKRSTVAPIAEAYAVFLAGAAFAFVSMLLSMRFTDRIAREAGRYGDLVRASHQYAAIEALAAKERKPIPDEWVKLKPKIETGLKEFSVFVEKSPRMNRWGRFFAYVALLLLGAGLSIPLWTGVF